MEGSLLGALQEGYANAGALNRQLLPAFGDLPLDRIAAVEVNRWFDRYSRTAPGGANHALDVRS